ncbi:MAG: HupE/UreJ family protein [Gemmatimonadetes bacterium]|nr:HupE/UreJ family protein [Gemmatimonadota bacterium]
MRGRRQRRGAIVALAAAAWVPVVPAEGAGFAAAPAPERHSPVVAAPVPLPHARPAAAPAPLPHEIPADVIVRAFVKAEGGVLRLVLRVPLTSMRDVDFPVRGPGYVEIDEASLLLDDLATLWIAGYVTLYEEAARLPVPVVTATRISLPSDPSFADYDRAVAHMSAPPIPPGVDLVLEQAMLDVLLETPIRSADSRFSIDPAWAHLGIRTTTVLRFVTPEGAERVFQYTGSPGQVRLDPRWHQALLRFVVLGFAHILDGIDHLLFLLCLVVPLRRLWPLVSVVTAFTVAHSITLGASVLGLAPNALWFPPLIEMLIAASIVFMALENIVGRTLERRWLWAFGFGLVHGFGFSFQLRESLQFAGSHLYTSLLGFNIGVELGQLFALLFMVPALALLFAKVAAPRIGGIVVSALVAHTSWHWMTERWSVFSAYDFQPPTWDAGFWTMVMRWVLLLLIVVGAAWGMAEGYRRLTKRFGGAGGDGAGAEGEGAGA